MKRFCGRLLLCLALLLCLHMGLALADAYESYTLFDLHYTIPQGYDFVRPEDETGDAFLHMTDREAVGQGAISATPTRDDYRAIPPRAFYRQFAEEMTRQGQGSIRSEETVVSGQPACLLYATGDHFGLGESSSATLVVLQEDCCYALTWYSPTAHAATEWRSVITDVYLGDKSQGLYNARPSEGPFTPLKPGDQSESVRTLQRRLIELGYLKGFANGRYTSSTEAAVRAYQQDSGLTVTGECDASTHRSLQLPAFAAAADVPTASPRVTAPKATRTPRPTATPRPTVRATPRRTKAPADSEPASYTYIYNKGTKKFHIPSCKSV